MYFYHHQHREKESVLNNGEAIWKSLTVDSSILRKFNDFATGEQVKLLFKSSPTETPSNLQRNFPSHRSMIFANIFNGLMEISALS